MTRGDEETGTCHKTLTSTYEKYSTHPYFQKSYSVPLLRIVIGCALVQSAFGFPFCSRFQM